MASSIFTYLDYHRWLGDAVAAAKARDPALTQRVLGERCGYRSSGALSLIASGRRRMSESAVTDVARGLGLDANEREHLRLMVRYESATDVAARARLVEAMTAAARFAETHADTIASYRFFASWTVPVVRELVALDHFVEDPAWIADQVRPRITADEASAALGALLELGHLVRDATGALRQAQPIISTPPEVRSEVLKAHQRQMMALAGDALDTQPRQRRDMRVSTVAISRAQAERIKALVTRFHQEVFAVVEEDDPIEVVYQLNTQWFALSALPDDAEPLS